MFQSPFPKYVNFLGSNGPGNSKLLSDGELGPISQASESRKAQFLLGRSLAKKLLKEQREDGPLLTNTDGSPLWPTGFVGSITHKGDWGFCAISKTDQTLGIGIDLEIVRKGKDILNRVANSNEKAWVTENTDEFFHRQTALFSAKESLFKCLYPITNKFFGFKDVDLSFENEKFNAKLLVDLSDTFKEGLELQIGLLKCGDHILTYTHLPKL